MNVLTVVLNVVALAGFCAALVAGLCTRGGGLGAVAKLFLCLALLTCVFTSVSNVLEHTGETDLLDVYEDYGEILFVPFSLSFIYAVWTRQELDRRKQVEKALAHERYLLHAIMDNAPDGIYFKDADSRFTRISKALAKRFGLDDPVEAVGRSDFDFFSEEHARQAYQDEQEIIRTGAPLVGKEERETWPGGRETWVSTTKLPLRSPAGEAVGTFGISRDITERKRAEEQLRQAQKMEAVGRLAGGIAHDFNNQLTIVKGYCDLLLAEPGVPASTRDQLEEVRKAAQRATTLTAHLLAFGRKQRLRPEVIFLNDTLEGMARPLGRMIGEDVRLSILAAPDLGYVKADPAQFEQSLMNLAVNARDAMPEGGELTIETANVDLDAAFAAAHTGGPAGPHVRVAVRDTGTGMNEETKRQVFEPFFTTKPVGQGTGLGLAMVYGFVKQSGGHIYVDSEPGRGTTFSIYLPRVAGPADAQAAPVEGRPGRRGNETVLVVEDDESVRQLVVSVLRQYGYTALEATGARDALPLGEHYDGTIDLLLTDVVMPGLNGLELAERLRPARPRMPVLYMSGYAEPETLRSDGDGARHFLRKPFRTDVLLERIRAILDEPPAT